MNPILRILVLILTIVMIPWAHSAPQPIVQAETNRSGFLYNRQTDTFDTVVTIRNVGTVPLAAPVRLILESVRPASVSLYNIYGKTALGKPYVEVPISGFVIEPGKSATVPVRFVNLGKNVTNATFSVQAEPLEPIATAHLQIVARMNAENGGNPVEAGYMVKLDGVTRAMTDAQGRASIITPLDVSEITVSSPPNYYGSALVVELTAGEIRTIEMELGDSGELGAESMLRMDRLQHYMLPINVPLVILRFFQNEKSVASDLVEVVELRDPAGGALKDITGLFTIRRDGSLAANPADFFTAIGNLSGKKLLFAQVLDKQGISHLQETPFYVSQRTVQGRLSAPPSNPGLPLGGIPIQISVLNTDISFQTESASDGTFPLPQMPSGNLLIQAQTSSGGTNYLAQGTAVVASNVRINIRMRGPVDVTNNVPPIITSPL